MKPTYEFSRQTIVPLMSKYENLIILRTFSKWAGLAGLRVGYGLFPPAIADFILRIKIPYNVNVAAIVAVEESLKDNDYLMASVQKLIDERERLVAQLQNNQLAYRLSDTIEFYSLPGKEYRCQGFAQTITDEGNPCPLLRPAAYQRLHSLQCG